MIFREKAVRILFCGDYFPASHSLLKERLRRALAKLPAEDAELFVLCYLEGYSYSELAEQFQAERGTIASRLHRIRAVLQKHLSR